VRLAEGVARLSLAPDVAGGVRPERGLRRSLLAVWLGEDLGPSEDELSNVYYVLRRSWFRRKVRTAATRRCWAPSSELSISLANIALMCFSTAEGET
jgi:hypothetical protein